MSYLETTSQQSPDAKWFVIYTKARCEKKVAEGLKERGIEVFCPMLKTRRRWSDRYKWTEEPLLRSYCFVKLEDRDRHVVFGVNHVVRYLFWQGKPAIVRDEEISVLQQLLNDHDHDNFHIRPLEVNDRIRVKGGPLDFLEGEIKEKRGHKLQVYMEALQLVVCINTETSRVEKAF